MNDTLLITLVTAISSLISSLVTHNITKKKFKAEVNSVELTNLVKQLEFYKNLVADYKEQLDTYIEIAEQTRTEMLRLRAAMTSIVFQVCKTNNCKERTVLQTKEIQDLVTQKTKE